MISGFRCPQDGQRSARTWTRSEPQDGTLGAGELVLNREGAVADLAVSQHLLHVHVHLGGRFARSRISRARDHAVLVYVICVRGGHDLSPCSTSRAAAGCRTRTTRLGLNVFWTSLTFLDPLAIALLLYRRRAGSLPGLADHHGGRRGEPHRGHRRVHSIRPLHLLGSRHPDSGRRVHVVDGPERVGRRDAPIRPGTDSRFRRRPS